MRQCDPAEELVGLRRALQDPNGFRPSEAPFGWLQRISATACPQEMLLTLSAPMSASKKVRSPTPLPVRKQVTQIGGKRNALGARSTVLMSEMVALAGLGGSTTRASSSGPSRLKPSSSRS